MTSLMIRTRFPTQRLRHFCQSCMPQDSTTYRSWTLQSIFLIPTMHQMHTVCTRMVTTGMSSSTTQMVSVTSWFLTSILTLTGTEYIGAVWPGYTVFPDWHASNAVSWWSDSLLEHHKNVPWDGIWIDMSEVSSFCVGSCGSNNLSYNPVHTPFLLPGEPGNVDYNYPEGFELTNATEAASIAALSASQSASLASAAGPTPTTSTTYFTPQVTLGARNVNHPPYSINNIQGDLAVHAMSPNGTHADGVLDYDIHNLFGHQILNATYQGLLKVLPGKRPFIIGRSTFAGSGLWAGHWGGDNISKFKDMYFSISQALGFSIFGIPMFGVDTCGFSSNSDEELCNRWMQVSKPLLHGQKLTISAFRFLPILPQP